MKILPSNRVNFGSIPIYKINLRKAADKTTTETVPAFISMLEKSDEERVLQTLRQPQNIFTQSIGKKILSDYETECLKSRGAFLDNKFFIVENVKEPVEKQIKAAAFMTYGDDFAFLELLQSERGYKKEKALKGAGSAILYAITKFAKSQRKDGIYLIPEDRKAEKFYRKFGFKRNSFFSKEMTLTGNNFENLEERVEQKYPVSQIADITPHAKEYRLDIGGFEMLPEI